MNSKYFHSLAVAFLFGLILGLPISCSQSSSIEMGLAGARPLAPTSLVLKSSEEYLNIQPLKDATLVVVSPSGKYGSSVAIAKGNPGKTILLTAAHIFVDEPGIALPVGTELQIYGYQIEIDLEVKGRLMKIAVEIDLALVEMDYVLNPVQLADKDPVEGTVVLAVGYPMNIVPCIGTIGVVFNVSEGEIHHTAGIYYGNSGGPLFDLHTHRMVGINIHIFSTRGIRRSDNAGARSIEEVHKFLSEKK